jgi:hypothetical protein
MPNESQIPEVLRLVIREAQRSRLPEEDDAASRYVLAYASGGYANLAEYLAARRQGGRR